VIVAAVILVAALALCGLKVGVYNVLPWADAVVLGQEIGGGVYALYQVKEPGDEAQMAETIKILQSRFEEAGHPQARVTRRGEDQIRIELNHVDGAADMVVDYAARGTLQFVDSKGNVHIKNEHVDIADAITDEDNYPIMQFVFNEEGKKIFGDVTTELVGESLTVQLDGVEMADPTINEPIPGGSVTLGGFDSAEQTEYLELMVDSGELPLELVRLQWGTVEADWGTNAAGKVGLACLILLAAAVVWMLVRYRTAGTAAAYAMLSGALLVLLVLALVPALVLDAYGFAALLTGGGIWMLEAETVHSRMRREIALGKSPGNAAEIAFNMKKSSGLNLIVIALVALAVIFVLGGVMLRSFALIAALFTVLSVAGIWLFEKYLLDLLMTAVGQAPEKYGVRRAEEKEGAK